MIYAIVAPGFSLVTKDWAQIERAKALYPYPKWKKCYSEEEANHFVKVNHVSKPVQLIENYGDTFKDLYVDATYTIRPDSVCYVFDVSRIGQLRINSDNLLVEYGAGKIYVRLPDIYLSEEALGGHMSAIYNLLLILGDYIDVNIHVKYFSVFYALTQYNGGRVRSISVTKNLINSRICKCAFTLRSDAYGRECVL